MPSTFGSWAADNRLKGLVFLVLAFAVIALGAYTYYTLKQSKYVMTGPNTISVTGKGEVFVKPDIATFSFSVLAETADAASAQEKSAESINKIMDFLKGQSVEEKDIKTLAYDLQPKYEWTNAPCDQFGRCPVGEQKLVGYSVNQTIEVKVRETAKSAALISGVGENGATNVSGLTFKMDDEEASKAEARELAIKDAKEKAEKLADQLDVRLVRFMNYWEQEGPVYPMYGYGGDMMSASVAKEERAVAQLPSGENKITSMVTLVYEIR